MRANQLSQPPDVSCSASACSQFSRRDLTYTARIPHAGAVERPAKYSRLMPPPAAAILRHRRPGRARPSWRRSLPARRSAPGRSPPTATAVEQLAAFLAAHGMPTARRGDPPRACRGVRRRPAGPPGPDDRPQPLPRLPGVLRAGASRRASPREPDGAHEAAPLPEAPPPVLRERGAAGDPRRLRARPDVRGRRDEAILRVFMDTGARRAEVLGLRRRGRRPRPRLRPVTGKGSRTRWSARRHDGPGARPLSARRGRSGAVPTFPGSGSGARASSARPAWPARSATAGRAKPGCAVHPHLFRHAYAHSMLPPACRSPTSWPSPAGSPARCSRATRRPPGRAGAKGGPRPLPVDRLDEGKGR